MAQSAGAGRAFPAFPYPPYDIQLQFMDALYSALEQGGVGLFESPTGTGKTLSLICSSLQWLQDQRRREATEAAAAAAAAATGGSRGSEKENTAGNGAAGRASEGQGSDDEDDAPDWMRGFGEQQERERQQVLQERQRRRIARARARLLGGSSSAGAMSKAAAKQRSGSGSVADANDPEAEFLVDDWHSNGDDSTAAGNPGGSARKRSPGTAGLGAGLPGSSDSEGGSDAQSLLGEDEEVEAPRKRQIIFASRTHSQLTQFVGELKRTPFAEEVSLVALGSRKALCINNAVLRLQSASLINERCLEMQKHGSSSSSDGSKKAAVAAAAGGDAVGLVQRKAAKAGSSSSGRCLFLASGTAAAATTRDMILAQPIDIEELAKLGRRKSVCPYYSARRAVPEADIILAPYSCLLVKETRVALGLRIEGNVVVVDEGHNLVDAINSSHSAELAAPQAATAQRQLSAYLQRFQSRLAPSNCRHIQTLLRVAQVLSQAASGSLQLAPTSSSSTAPPATNRPGRQPSGAAPAAAGATASASSGCVLTVNDFLLRSGLDNLNLFKLVRYVRESKVVFKVAGFWQAQQRREAAAGATTAAAPAARERPAGDVIRVEAAVEAAAAAGTGALHALVSFVQALTNADADGRIVVQPPTQQHHQYPQHHPQQQRQQQPLNGRHTASAGGTEANGQDSHSGGTGTNSLGGSCGGDGMIKFVLLNAAAHFGRVVSAAHAVVLASGTLSPLESVLHLFPGVPPERLHRFACGHVVEKERLLALAVGTGPSGAALDFRHATRGSTATLDELGRLVANTCQVVHGGVVVFFPSFSYADQVHARWQQSGLLRQLAARKRVFREPRLAGEVDTCLQQYADCIAAAGSGMRNNTGNRGSSAAVSRFSAGQNGSTCGGSAGRSGGGNTGGDCSSGSKAGGLTGAMMLCVVGGKLAEGINFGDALGRCVIMVGLPYPDPSDPELKERMAFMDRAAAEATATAAGRPGTAAMPTLQAPLGTAAAAGPAASAACAAASRGSNAGCAWGVATAAASQQGRQQQQRAAAAAQACQIHLAAPPASHYQQHQQHRPHGCLPVPDQGCDDGRAYYQNLCMKAVNQCIGRVIRHRGDWAAVMLVDARYAEAVDSRGQLMGPLAKLPNWIQQSLQVTRSFGDAFGRLARFSKTMAAAS